MKKQIVLQSPTTTIMSMEVAEMVEKEHKYLMRDIRRYSTQMDGAKISPSDFWTESFYMNSQNKQQNCYLITRKGCEFIAHKMTGPKGTVFTARYINRFHEMEQEMAKNAAPKKVIPMRSQTEAPRMADWYSLNRNKIEKVCKIHKLAKSRLYHIILNEIGKSFDIKACRKIYQKEKGYPPSYAMDIVPYFPELQTVADNMLEDMECPFFFRDSDVCPFD